MLESFPVALAVSTALGFLAGLGVGGGSLLILWLTLALEMAYPQARLINLLFFLPSAVIATFINIRKDRVVIKKITPAVIAGCIAAAAASALGKTMDTEILKKLFGGLLILTGIRELFYKEKQAP